MRWLSSLALMLCCLMPVSSWATFSVANSGGTAEAPSLTTIAQTLTTVTAGDAVAIFVTHEGLVTSITVSDGSSTFASCTKTTHANADLHGQWFYTLSSVASGTVTYTATFGAARISRSISVLELSHAVTVDIDVCGQGSGNATALTSANVTTTGSVGAGLGGYAPYSAAVFSAPLINGTAATTTVTAGDGRAWFLALSSTFSNGAATATLATASEYIVNILVLKEVTAGTTETFGFRRRRQQ